MKIPKNITSEHVIKAIQKIKRDGGADPRTAARFCLRYGNRLYSAPNVLSVANFFANGDELHLDRMKDEEEINRFFSRLGFNIVQNPDVQKDEDSPIYSKQELGKNDTIVLTESEKESIIKERISQSDFKTALLNMEKKCKFCGISDENFLVARHIKPWSISNEQKRLDVNNGLLLCPNHEILFERGYISFEETGKTLISDQLNERTIRLLNINNTVVVHFNPSQTKYINWHRSHVFQI